MAKTLTAQAEAARTRRWAEIVYLLELTLWRDKFGASPVSTIIRLSDANRTELGQEWTALVQDWGDVGDALNRLDPSEGQGATLDVVLDNTKRIGDLAARFSDLIRHALNGGPNIYDLAFADATLMLLFKGGASGDELKLFRLQVEEATAVTPERLTLRMSGVELALENVDDLYRVSTLDFPSADPDAVGQPVPWLWGVLRNVPAMGLVSGLTDILRSDITTLSPGNGGTLPLSDPEIVNRLSSSGTLQIDSEPILYTGKDVVGPGVTGITRTAPTNHQAGATVFQVLSEYVYALGENAGAHKVKSVSRVRSNGILLDATSYTVQLSNTKQLPGRDLVLLRFPVLPIVQRQVKYDLTDGINVDDSIAVADKLGVGDNIAVGTSATEIRVLNAVDTLPAVVNAFSTRHFGLPPLFPPGGPVVAILVEIGWSGPGGGDALVRAFVNGVPYDIYVTSGITVRIDTRPVFFLQLGAVDVPKEVEIESTAIGPRQGSFPVTITKLTVTVQRQITVQKSGSAFRTGAVSKLGQAKKTGTVTLSGNSSADTVLGRITANVEGLKDDAAGTVTALTGGPGANALLEVPVDLVYLLMREFYGEAVVANFDAARWATTRTKQVSAGLTWAARFEGVPFSEFRRLAGLQGRADLFQDGGKWVYAYREIGTVQATLDDRTVIEDLVLAWTPRTEIVTALTVRSDWDAVNRQWRASRERRSTKFSDRFGTRGAAAKALDLLWVRADDAATELGRYWLEQWETPRMVVTATGTWEILALDKADTVAVSGTAFPILVPFGSIGYGVRGKTYLLDEDLIALEVVEIDQLPVEITKAARYRIAAALALTKAGRYRLVGPVSLSKGGTYRLATAIAPTKAAAYRIVMVSDPVKTGRYRLLKPVTPSLKAVYAIAVKWDQAGLAWDSTPIFWDGAAASQLLNSWDAATPLVWDTAGVRWDE